MQKSSEKKEKNKKKGDEKIFNKKILLIIISVIVIVAIAIALLFSGSFANDDIPVITETGVTLSCNDYTSFDGKLGCTISLKLARGVEISGISVKLSDEADEVSSITDMNDDPMVLNSGQYVDFIFANNWVNDQYGVSRDIATVFFDSIEDEKIITIDDVQYYGSKSGLYDIEGDLGVTPFINNPTEASKKASYDLDTSFTGRGLIDSEHLFMPSVENSLYEDVSALLSSNSWHCNGCTYSIDSSGQHITLTDTYNETRVINVIYVDVVDGNSYTIPWYAGEASYTRSARTDDQVKSDCYNTNGYFVLDETNHKIKLYADLDHNILISEKNWYYAYSTTYDFRNGLISIPGSISYDDFMSTFHSYGVTLMLGDIDNDKTLVSGDILGRFNKLGIDGVPYMDGTRQYYTSDIVSIFTSPNLEIDINNLDYSYVGGENDNEYVIYNIDPSTTIYDLLNGGIDISSGFYMLIDAFDNVIVPKTAYNNISEDTLKNIALTTEMKLVIKNGDVEFIYHLSVLGDVMPDGEINLSDVIKLYKIMKNTTTFTEAQRLAGDVYQADDKDQSSLIDVAHLYRYFRGVDNKLLIK